MEATLLCSQLRDLRLQLQPFGVWFTSQAAALPANDVFRLFFDEVDTLEYLMKIDSWRNEN